MSNSFNFPTLTDLPNWFSYKNLKIYSSWKFMLELGKNFILTELSNYTFKPHVCSCSPTKPLQNL